MVCRQTEMVSKLSNAFVTVFACGTFVLLLSLFREDFQVTDYTRPVVRWYAKTVDFNQPESIRRSHDEKDENWPYKIRVVKGWEPDKTKNISFYLRPSENTTLIMPRLLVDSKVIAMGQEEPKTHLIVVCQSSFEENSSKLRQVIRDSWASDAEKLPVTVVFLLGTTTNSTMQKMIKVESKKYADILQEDFVDTYSNLTLKSMFMLKFMTSLLKTSPQDSVKFLLKTDDDCFINLISLIKYTRVLAKYEHTIFGHVLGEGSPVVRPDMNSTDRYTTKWEVPEYIYPANTYPNALSGSGYLIKVEDVPCLYEKGLETPFLNVEDVFITGLAASKCGLKHRSSPKFHFLGANVCQIKAQDILVHNIKDPLQMVHVYNIVSKKKWC